MNNILSTVRQTILSMKHGVVEYQSEQPEAINWMVFFAMGVGVDKITPIIPSYINGGKSPAFGLVVLLIISTPLVLVTISRKIGWLDEIPTKLADGITQTSAICGMVAVMIIPVSVGSVMYLMLAWVSIYTVLLVYMSNKWVVDGMYRKVYAA